MRESCCKCRSLGLNIFVRFEISNSPRIPYKHALYILTLIAQVTMDVELVHYGPVSTLSPVSTFFYPVHVCHTPAVIEKSERGSDFSRLIPAASTWPMERLPVSTKVCSRSQSDTYIYLYQMR